MKNTTLSKNNFSTFDSNQALKNLDYEWLVTNGLGGYSSGTISGILNRRYHPINRRRRFYGNGHSYGSSSAQGRQMGNRC
jgi:hypothetical protein